MQHISNKLSSTFSSSSSSFLRSNGELQILTKGDANAVDDRGLYAYGQDWLSRKDIVGKAKAFIPHVGVVTILMNDYPILKYVLVGVMMLFVLANREN
jgi:signal peptidase